MYFPAGDTGAPSHRQENRSVSHCCIGVVVCRDPAVRRLGIIKGPLGFVLIYETYHSLSKMSDRQKTERIASEKRLTKEVRKAIMKGNKFPVVGEGSRDEAYGKNTKHKKAESVAETLCSFSGFLCDIVISVYMIVILMVLPLYNKGYARIGTEKETFFSRL